MWGVADTEPMTALANVTYIFDACGAYDFKNDGNPIAKGSQFEAWGNALSFLEWYGIPLMEGFGIIIIDDENPNKYYTITGETSYTEVCFESGLRLVVSAAVSLSMLALTFIAY